MVSKKCSYCGQRNNHTNDYKERQSKCSAFKHRCTHCHTMGHYESLFQRRNISKPQKVEQNTTDTSIVNSEDTENAVFDNLCVCEESTSTINYTPGVLEDSQTRHTKCATAVGHYIYENNENCWQLRPSDGQPTLKVCVKVCKSSYSNLFCAWIPHLINNR